MDTTGLRDAYRALLDAAASVADTPAANPPASEWNADQILGHIALVDAGTIAAAYAIAAGANATYDNRTALDLWTIGRVIALTGGTGSLCERIRLQGEALCALAENVLSDEELDRALPTLLVSADSLMVDQLVPLRAIIAGLADDHLPRHTSQLLALYATEAAS